MVHGDDSATRPLWERLEPIFEPSTQRSVRESHRPPLPVPTTAVYSRTDGIVHWQACLTVPGTTAENVEVYGSHSGLGFNPSVAYLVADRLGQPAGRWESFRPPFWLRGLYPRPAAGPIKLQNAR